MTQPNDLEVAGHPREGMQATLRNRRGLIASVEPFDAPPEGRLHLTRIEYIDRDGPPEDTVIWEREPNATVLEPHALPRVDQTDPMPERDFDALVRAARWSALTPFLAPDGSGTRSELPIAAPFFGAVQVDDFQLVPLLQALQMPRVSLLLADDVGLGKTIEAGLILSELLIRRRIRRVLILTPASLRTQWRQEMHDKFALSFDVIDRGETHALQKRLGLDANPWRTFPRIISSYYYLRQPDVLEQFLATCRSQDEGSQLAQLPWDLLIVDEAHNLTPSNFGDDSELSKMLRAITPWFEHKLFLTATPHNGHTRCFSGLLEQLDPVRFTQTSEFTEAEKERVRQVVVRRLKSEINDLDDAADRPRRFPYRDLTGLPLELSAPERNLSAAVEVLRTGVKRLISAGGRGEQLAGNFAVEILSKRLLSSPSTFAESWFRLKLGLAEDEEAEAAEVAAAGRAAEEDIDDDLEREGRTRHAARTIGAWLKPLASNLESEMAAVDDCLEALDLEPLDGDEAGVTVPRQDARFTALCRLVDERLRRDGDWRDDERLILFTEYKTTLDDLEKRLKPAYDDPGEAIRVLYGGMDDREREAIKTAFNDPADPVRVLIGTDAASEGLNLQKTARYILHYEVPWNPSRLEQRNGRLDRYGQARDVEVFHFTSNDDADLRFIGKVVGKVHNIREDLGSMGEVFDAAFQRRFLDQEETDRVLETLDRDVEIQEGAARIERRETKDTGSDHLRALDALCRELDLSPGSLRDTLEIALGLKFGLPRLEGPDSRGRFKLVHPLPPRWQGLIDDTLRLEVEGSSQGKLPRLLFDPELLVDHSGDRPVFRSNKDSTLLHLGHPLFHQALADLARARFPGGANDQATRWTVRFGEVPDGAQALLLLTLEELAVNQLREPFHNWARTLRVPIVNNELGEPLAHAPAAEITGRPPAGDELAAAAQRAAALWLEVETDAKKLVRRHKETLATAIAEILTDAGTTDLELERERFKDRISEVERAMKETSLGKLERERDKLQEQMKQLVFSQEQQRDREARLRDLEQELERRRSHYRDLLDLLKRDQHRVLEITVPRRFSLPEGDAVQVYPVTIEILLPEVTS